jgi:hypothetical protein
METELVFDSLDTLLANTDRGQANVSYFDPSRGWIYDSQPRREEFEDIGEDSGS